MPALRVPGAANETRQGTGSFKAGARSCVIQRSVTPWHLPGSEIFAGDGAAFGGPVRGAGQAAYQIGVTAANTEGVGWSRPTPMCQVVHFNSLGDP
jgi:hypothetical protein